MTDCIETNQSVNMTDPKQKYIWRFKLIKISIKSKTNLTVFQQEYSNFHSFIATEVEYSKITKITSYFKTNKSLNYHISKQSNNHISDEEICSL